MKIVDRVFGRSHILLFSAVGCATALFLLIVVVVQFPSVPGASPQEEKGNKRTTSNTSLKRCDGIESEPNMNFYLRESSFNMTMGGGGDEDIETRSLKF